MVRSAVVCNGRYLICEDGRVFRMTESGSKEMRFTASGYFTLQSGTGKQVYLHRLIAQTFVPNPENLPCVNHIDGNKHNNSASNLEWVSQRDNVILMWATGQRKSKNPALIPKHEATIRERYGKSLKELRNGDAPMTITSTNSPNYTRLASTWLDILSRRQGMRLGCVTIERTEEHDNKNQEAHLHHHCPPPLPAHSGHRGRDGVG